MKNLDLFTKIAKESFFKKHKKKILGIGAGLALAGGAAYGINKHIHKQRAKSFGETRNDLKAMKLRKYDYRKWKDGIDIKGRTSRRIITGIDYKKNPRKAFKDAFRSVKETDIMSKIYDNN